MANRKSREMISSAIFAWVKRRRHVKLKMGAERKCGPKRPRMTHDKRGTRPTGIGRNSVHCDPGTFSQKGARRSEICTVRPGKSS